MSLINSVKSINALFVQHGFLMVQLASLIILGGVVFFSGYVADSDGYNAWMYFFVVILVMIFIGIILFLSIKSDVKQR